MSGPRCDYCAQGVPCLDDACPVRAQRARDRLTLAGGAAPSIGDSSLDGGDRPPMSDDRLLSIKRRVQQRHERACDGKVGVALDPAGELAMLIDLLVEVDRLRAHAKLYDQECGMCGSDADELVEFMEWKQARAIGKPPLGPVPDRFRPEVREAFLRQAVIELGAPAAYRRVEHQQAYPSWTTMSRTAKECAERAAELWRAYCDIQREPGSG